MKKNKTIKKRRKRREKEKRREEMRNEKREMNRTEQKKAELKSIGVIGGEKFFMSFLFMMIYSSLPYN